jgi:hypothetical protein
MLFFVALFTEIAVGPIFRTGYCLSTAGIIGGYHNNKARKGQTTLILTNNFHSWGMNGERGMRLFSAGCRR